MPIRTPIVRAFATASLAIALAGCGGASDAQKKELDEIRAEMAKLRAEQGAMAERLDAIQLRGARARSSDVPAPDQPPESDRPDLNVVRLAPEPPASAKEPDDGGEPPKTIRMIGSSVDTKGDKPDADFERGVDLHKKRLWDKCLDVLAAFLVKSPDSPNADQATFLRGDCYFQKGDTQRAAEQWNAVATSFPQSPKAPEALKRLAEAQAKLGDKAAAEDTKKKLHDLYPTSEAAKKPGFSPKK